MNRSAATKIREDKQHSVPSDIVVEIYQSGLTLTETVRELKLRGFCVGVKRVKIILKQFNVRRLASEQRRISNQRRLPLTQEQKIRRSKISSLAQHRRYGTEFDPFGRRIESDDATRIMRKVRNYPKSSLSRGLEMTLSEQERWMLITSPCTMCGVIPDPCGGIDRIDNSKGYIPGNVQPSCWTCNDMKNNMSMEQFCLHIHKIANKFDIYNCESTHGLHKNAS